ncbi:hypothetical protein Tco_1212247, partial [Tanacetum coccineum]
KFDFASVKIASTPIETQKPLVKDEEANDVDVQLYRSMISSLMYVTASRPDIMFAVCACSRFQVTPKTSHLSAVKRVFRYLKGKPKIGLWYPRESSFDLESYSDSDYAGANLDRKSTIGGVVRPTKRRVYVMFDNKEDAYHWSEVMLVNALRRFRESLRRVTDGAEAFLILTLFILCLDKVSTDHAKLVPLGKVCTAKETLEKNTAKGTKCKLEPLISLTDDLSLLSNMAALESCPKHNMIAYLEKTEGNVEFHEVIDFLRRSYIYHALTVSPVVSTTFVEQFWTSAKSKTINNVRHITAKVAGKFVSISEASIRTDLIFDDADGIDSLPNQAIFDAIQLMGYEGDLTPASSHPQEPSPTATSPIQSQIPTVENLEIISSNDTSLSGIEDDMTRHNDIMNSLRISSIQPSTSIPKESFSKTQSQVQQSSLKLNEERGKRSLKVLNSKEEVLKRKLKVQAARKIKVLERIKPKKNLLIKPLKYQHTTKHATVSEFSDDEKHIATLSSTMSKANAASKEKEKDLELKDTKGRRRLREDESESEDDDIPPSCEEIKHFESDEEFA